MKSFVDYCKDRTVEALEGMRGRNKPPHHLGLAYGLAEAVLSDGPYEFSIYEKPREYIREWRDEVMEAYKYQDNTHGGPLANPLKHPESFLVCMVEEGIYRLCANCPSFDSAGNDETGLTDAVIDSIIAEIKAQNVIEF